MSLIYLKERSKCARSRSQQPTAHSMHPRKKFAARRENLPKSLKSL